MKKDRDLQKILLDLRIATHKSIKEVLDETQQEYEGVHKLFRIAKEKGLDYQNQAEAKMLIIQVKMLDDYRVDSYYIGKQDNNGLVVNLKPPMEQ